MSLEEKVYTPDEVAEIFQISKHTVYELIKRGELQAFKIGNKMRIEHSELVRYKGEQKAGPSQRAKSNLSGESKLNQTLRLAGSHDLLVEQLIKFTLQQSPPIHIQPTFIGSLEGLMMLYRGQCDIAAVHLLDPSSQEYNLPFIRQLFIHENISVIRFTARKQGLIVAKGNPKDIRTVADLTKAGVRFINRQKGSGTRFLFDSLLANNQLNPQSINGYDKEEWNHLSSASYINSNKADVTFGIAAAAAQLGLDFIPIATEQFDLVFRWTEDNKDSLTNLLELLQAEALRVHLSTNAGYDLSQLGEVMINLKGD